MGKRQQHGQQTLEFSLKCSSFLLYIIFKTVVFIRFGDPSLHSIDLTGCCILGEKRCDKTHIWVCICLALCSRVVFSIRIALCVPQPKIFLLLTFYFIYYCYYNYWSLINIHCFIYCLSIIIVLIIIIIISLYIFIIISISWVIIF